MGLHPCLTCGACCAFFRCSFYWAETTEGGGTVPPELTVQVSPFLVAMKGTELPAPRCEQLDGQIGQEVSCRIHPLRPSPCRDFVPSFEDGNPNERCDRARARVGLAPLTPEDYGGTPGPSGPPHQIGGSSSL